jgi:hypothetical protein
VPLEKAKIAAPAAPLETYTSVPAPASEADGAVATVYVGTLISPIKPAVEVTGPENVVEAILSTLCIRIRSVVYATSGGLEPVYKADVCPSDYRIHQV